MKVHNPTMVYKRSCSWLVDNTMHMVEVCLWVDWLVAMSVIVLTDGCYGRVLSTVGSTVPKHLGLEPVRSSALCLVLEAPVLTSLADGL